MICPKCKKELAENTIKCPHCNTKVASLCPRCNSYNEIYRKKCKNCDRVLLLVCPACKSANLYGAKNCRKCNTPLIAENENKNIEPKKEIEQTKQVNQEPQNTTITNNLEFKPVLHSQFSAKNLLVEKIQDETTKILSIAGPSGCGKNTVLKTVMNELENSDRVWLIGTCTPLKQISPLGLFQDILLTFFNITDYCIDILGFKKDSFAFFKQEFPELSSEEIFALINILYPEKEEFYENIISNKEMTLSLLTKVFKKLLMQTKAVFTIDNFEFIDGLSYELLHRFLKTEEILKNAKFLITYSELRPSASYFCTSEITTDAFCDVFLGLFDKDASKLFIERFSPASTYLSDKEKEEIINKTEGKPAYIEQIMYLYNECRLNEINFVLPENFKSTIAQRLQIFKTNHTPEYQLLLAASSLGLRFYPSMLKMIFNYDDTTFNTVFSNLLDSNYIFPVSEIAFEFRNHLLWSTIVELVKEDETFIKINEKIYEAISKFTLSSNTLKIMLAQNLGLKQDILNIWTKNIKLAAAIGDTHLYTVAQIQALNLIQYIDTPYNDTIKINATEGLAKVLSFSNPEAAIKYLPDAIKNAKSDDNLYKQIELSGYLANCCLKTKNHFGVIECVDFVLSKLDDEFELEIALIKSRKLRALLAIGNCGEVVNLIDNEIMPIIEKYLDSSRNNKNISIAEIYETWLKTYLTLADALAYQGDNRAFEVIKSINEIYQKNEIDNKLFLCKVKLVRAFANTVRGDVKVSEKILEDIIYKYRTDTMDEESISRWNLINILNKFLRHKYKGLQEELFTVVDYANNINDNFTKNILKTLLGKLFKETQRGSYAVDIYSEQLTYFAQEKLAIGALLGWTLIAEGTFITEGPKKSLEVAQQALDVAQSPKINNYYFIAALNKLIAEAYIAFSDFENAKIHLEKAILISKKFELLDLLAKSYLLYGKYLQELALTKSELQNDYAKNAAKMFKNSLAVATTLEIEHIKQDAEKAINVLNSFCTLNNIELKVD